MFTYVEFMFSVEKPQERREKSKRYEHPLSDIPSWLSTYFVYVHFESAAGKNQILRSHGKENGKTETTQNKHKIKKTTVCLPLK